MISQTKLGPAVSDRTFCWHRLLGAALVRAWSNATDSRRRRNDNAIMTLAAACHAGLTFCRLFLPRPYTLAAEKDGSSLMLPLISVSVGPLIIHCNVITTAMCRAATVQKNAPAILIIIKKKYRTPWYFFDVVIANNSKQLKGYRVQVVVVGYV